MQFNPPKKASVPRGVYIHIPFCRQKCHYCDFFSLSIPNGDPILKRYTRAVLQEIKNKAELFPETEVSSIYLGGGTPTLLDTSDLTDIIRTVCHYFAVRDGCEITLEANPATLDKEKVKGIQDAGFNRLSLGVQSFEDEELKILGRIHSAEQVLETVHILNSAGCNNFNLDLIYGIPGQTMNTWGKSLQKAVECEPAHISIYLLQLDEKTPLAKQIDAGLLKLPEDDREARMYEKAMEYLPAQGFHQYEISNFARKGFECRHNLQYWQAGEYLGIGAGAVSYTGSERYLNQTEIRSYVESLEAGRPYPVEVLESMNHRERAIDALVLGMRLCEGIHLHEFEKRYGIDVYQAYRDIIDRFIDAEVLNLASGKLSFSKRGYFLSNQVLCQFMG